MHYELFIPATTAEGFDVTMTVEADNWMSALKSGLERIGEGPVRNLMCDIKGDNTIHVTDATSRRVFILREIDEPEISEGVVDESAPDTVQTSAVDLEPDTIRTEALERPAEPVAQQPVAQQPVAQQPVAQQPVAQQPVAQQPVADQAVADQAVADQAVAEAERPRIGSATFEALQRDEPKPRVLREKREKTGQSRVVEQPIGRVDESVAESLIEDVFLEVQEIHDREMSMEEVINFIMDMAVNKTEAESGSVLFADVNGKELYFATARGPKADAVMKFRVPMNKGIVGFCTRQGVSLAIGDVHQDPRFYGEISESLGYDTQALICAPIQHDGRVYGAIELINKRGKTQFTSDEMNALAYMGRQLGMYVYEVIMSKEPLA